MLVFLPTLNSHPVWAQWSNVSKTIGWMCLDLELGINSTGGSIKCCRSQLTERKTVPEENSRGFFSIPQSRLTASGRHAESSSFIYSMYYPTAFPSRSNCSLGRWQEEKDEKKTERERWELWNSKAMPDIQCQSKFWTCLIMILILNMIFSTKGVQLNNWGTTENYFFFFTVFKINK